MADPARRARSAALATAWLCAAAAWAPDPAQACSVCLAGDPNFSTHGSSAQETGDFTVYFEARGWTKQSGLLPHGEETSADHDDGSAAEVANGPAEPLGAGRHPGHPHPDPDPPDGGDPPDSGHAAHEGDEDNVGRRLDLYVSWTPIDRATFTLDLPWAFNQIEENADGDRTHFSLSGFGDASLGASAVVWRSRDVLPSTWVEARGWVKAPTGRDEQRVDGVQDPHLQTGTGSWDFGFGAAVAHRLSWGSLYASGFYRVNTEGSLDYEFGDVALATAALEVPLGHALKRETLARFTPGFALDFRWAERDQQAGQAYDDSGGAILYATPSLRIQLPAWNERQRAWLRTAIQIPTTNAWLHGEQDEGTVWSVGIGYGF